MRLKNIHFFALSFGAVIVFFISELAIKGIYHSYKSFLETVTVRAKIEQRLGLADISDIEYYHWGNEPIVYHRYIESRNKYNSSAEFVKSTLNEDSHKWTKFLFTFFKLISIFMFIVSVIFGMGYL